MQVVITSYSIHYTKLYEETITFEYFINFEKAFFHAGAFASVIFIFVLLTVNASTGHECVHAPQRIHTSWLTITLGTLSPCFAGLGNTSALHGQTEIHAPHALHAGSYNFV